MFLVECSDAFLVDVPSLHGAVLNIRPRALLDVLSDARMFSSKCGFSGSCICITFMTRNSGYIATAGLDTLRVRISIGILPTHQLSFKLQALWVLRVFCSSRGATSTRIFSHSFHAATVELEYEVVGSHGVAIMLPKNLSTSNESHLKWATSLSTLCGNPLVSLVRMSYLHLLKPMWQLETVWSLRSLGPSTRVT